MNGGILTINVGGTVFQIWSYGTAMKKVDTVEVAYSELGLLLRPDRPMNHRSKIGFELQRGSFFIDRDGTYFRFVLDYLRGILSEKNKKQFTDEILEEAKFYGLKELEDEMKKYTHKAPTKPINATFLRRLLALAEKYGMRQITDKFARICSRLDVLNETWRHWCQAATAPDVWPRPVEEIDLNA